MRNDDSAVTDGGPSRNRPSPPLRSDFAHFVEISTRWMDNDIYGHVNNVAYYGYFDTAVNRYLIDRGVLDIHGGKVIGLVVESGCSYFSPVAFPQAVSAGLRVARLGSSSVRYEIAIFADDSAEGAACGHFVHVYVDRVTRRPVPLPAELRAALAALAAPPPSRILDFA